MKTKPQSPTLPREARAAFTLIELLVSMAVLSLLMVMVFSMVDQTQKTWNLARSRVSQFREARTAFEAVTRSLTQATLNPYWDYDYGSGKYKSSNVNSPTTPRSYQRQSELHFICGPSAELLNGLAGTDRRPGHSIFFQTAGGFGRSEDSSQLNDLLNARGYYVEYGEDSKFKPSFLNEHTKPRYRFRLMELRPPTENLLVYLRNLKETGSDGIGATKGDLRSWFKDQIEGETGDFQMSRPIADNIIAAFFLPKMPENDSTKISGVPVGVLTPDYLYDSREWQHSGSTQARVAFSKNRLPPLVEVTMVAVDEKSMIRYQQKNPGALQSMPDFIPSELFKRYSNYRSFLDDLGTLKTALDDAKIDYRVFNQTVPLRGSGGVSS